MKAAAQAAGTHSATPLFPIVGIGASAGGLDAYTRLLKMLPSDTGMAFVLVSHLAPTHESGLARLLGGVTTMPTQEVTNGLPVKPNHVYVIPPNRSMLIEDGVLKLQPRPPGRKPHRSIDSFFESLSQDRRELGIGVILSGTANDGTLGLECIKAEGGVTFAQDESAIQNSMPRSAIAAGCVDYVLSPEKIAEELIRIAKHPFITSRSWPPVLSETTGKGAQQRRGQEGRRQLRAEVDGFKKILLLLWNHFAVDFSLYKASSIRRRVTRRMLLNHKNTFAEYSAFLKDNAKELDALYSDVLISVTNFFRNPEAFESLKQTVFPRLLQRRVKDEALRVWVPACSTGQEAYSIAIAFAEFIENIARPPRLQIFATDLNEALLDSARQGLYAKTLAADVSQERLRRFFIEEEGGYRVIKSVREQIIFARQNLISDPPFSRLDLISCRNLLIYLESDLQKQIMPIFHYALKPGGFLFLGASESTGQFSKLFEAVDKRHKIFCKKSIPTPLLQVSGLTRRITHYSPEQRLPLVMRTNHEEELRLELNAQREADRISINQFAPPAVLINDELQILQFRGTTSAYLEPPSGKASFNLLKMARKGLMLPLRTAIERAKKDQQSVRIENVVVHQTGGDKQTVTIHVIAMKNVHPRCYLILFEPVSAKPGRRAPAAAPHKPLSQKEESQRVAMLEGELAETHDYLQSMQEQYEAANEALQASSEEIQSANEELQSINEELETSKEELESANEELSTLNEELVNRNAEVTRLNDDLLNLQANIHTAILLLGGDLTIRRFTGPAEKIFGLLATDIGRPLTGIHHTLVDNTQVAQVPGDSLSNRQGGTVVTVQQPYPLETLIRKVIDTATVHTCEVQDKAGHWYSLTVRPYRTLDNKDDGAVVILGDVDALKRSEQKAQAASSYNQAIVRTVRDPLLILYSDLRVDTANEAFYKVFKVTAQETEGRFVYEIGDGQLNIPALRTLLEKVLSRNRFFKDFEVSYESPTAGRRTMLLNARKLLQANEQDPRIFLSIEDATERLDQANTLERLVEQRTEALRIACDQAIVSSEAKSRFLATVSHEVRTPLSAVIGILELLATAFADEETSSMARMGLEEAKRLLHILNDLLDASKLQSGKITLVNRTFPLRTIIGDVVQLVKPEASKKGLEIRGFVDPEVPETACGDELRLRQVLLNLAFNAVKFTSGGFVTVGCSLHKRLANGVIVRFVVEDTGIGIAKAQMQKLFEPFSQANDAITRVFGGTGLGLSISKDLVSMMNGTIGVDSKPGEGSRFWLQIPFIDDPCPK